MLTFDLHEFEQCHTKVRRELERQGVDGPVLFSTQHIFYLSGFAHVQIERQMVFMLPLACEVAMLVLALEAGHLAARVPWLDQVRVYAEYPGL